jgi:hypothetical protein
MDQVENKSLRVTAITMMITMKTDYRMTLNCIYNPNNNEIHIPCVECNHHKSIKAQYEK